MLTWVLILSRWSYAVATRLASIVKTKADGPLKLRFVMDLLRPGVNGRSNPPERIVLPRITDYVASVLNLMVALWLHGGDQAAVNVATLMVVDFSDAF